MNTDSLVALAQAFADHSALKLSTVSTYAAGDGKFFGSLKNSAASCTIRRANRLVGWFSDHWPDDLEWPRDIPRPSKSKEAA